MATDILSIPQIDPQKIESLQRSSSARLLP